MPLFCSFLVNPLQCSCLENPRDGGSWWAAVYGVVQSRTRLKRLSSSSSSSQICFCCMHACMLSSFFATPWTIACQAPVSTARISQVNFPGKNISPARILEWMAICFIHRFISHSSDSMCKLYFMVFLCLMYFTSVQFSHPTLCSPTDCSMPGLPVHHQLLELTHTHVH